MHVLHVIASLSPSNGGPPEVVRQLAYLYSYIGDTMEVLTEDFADAPFLKDFPSPVHAVGQRIGRFAFSPRLWNWLHKNAARFDGMVMHGVWTFPGLAVRAAARKAGKPYAVFTHGALDPWFNREYPLKHLKKRIYWPVQYRVLRDAAAVMFTTAIEANLAKASFTPNEWNAALVPCGILEPEGEPAAEVEAFYELLPALRSRRYLLFLARIQAKKGCDLLIDAFARIAPLAPDLDLVMAGPDQTGWQASLQRMAEDRGVAHRVHWPGMLSGDGKWGALRAADAFVLPSHTENFGVAVVESLAAGRPVLISNKVNIWREIQADSAGLAEDDTLEGTERLLRRWIGLSPDERDAMITRTYPCFLSRYSLKGGALAINEIFSASGAARKS